MTTHATPATPEMKLADRRATVATLARDGASLRTIAAQLGVSKDTVRRDLAAVERDTARQNDTAGETASRDDATPATSDATDHATPATSALPASGEPLTIPTDAEFLADLAVMELAGRTTASAIGHAVHLVAELYRRAWASGAYPHGTEPQFIAHQLRPYTPTANDIAMDSNARSIA
ncbi:helix-turn-helix domain-containing protein [Streptomyces sp. NRRL F-5135]|uniref:helix-turn-helix domain-containing protein n=1 Tax=Streptomyces sp. NRRL F-5135 TaxID=1463858 RepID=UPI0004C4EEFC|nr:helix-turn-helix domain-containing protein [Streptomyces sp. NRRL F-5135]